MATSTPQLPVPGVARMVVHTSLGSMNAVNVFHVTRGAEVAWSQSDLDIATAAFRTAYKNTLLTWQSHDGSLGRVDSQDLTSELGVQSSVAGSDLGGQFSPALPANVAACITWVIARHYRGGHPRTYISMVPTNSTSDTQSFSTTQANNLKTAATNFIDQVQSISIGGGTPLALVALHRTRFKAPADPVLVDIITAAAVDTRIDSQRRRLGKDR